MRFTPDEWMARLFGEDPPVETFPLHAAAILDLMEPIWTRCPRLGVDVVLDYGFWRRAERDHARGLVEECGACALLYRVACSDEGAAAGGRAQRAGGAQPIHRAGDVRRLEGAA